MSTRQHVEILPPHPLRAGYDRSLERGSIADDFQRRLEPANFNPGYLGALTERVELALGRDPADETMRWRLAFLLLQNNATAAAVERAEDLLAGAVLPQSRRLAHLVAGIRSRAGLPRTGRGVRRVNWSINNRCPMSCQGCYNPFAAEQIDLAQADRIIAKLAAHGTTDLVLAGGDPLLWPPIFDVVDHAIAAGLKVGLDTTGYTLTAEKLDRLRGLSSLRLPLDAVTATRSGRSAAARTPTSSGRCWSPSPCATPRASTGCGCTPWRVPRTSTNCRSSPPRSCPTLRSPSG